MLRSKIEEIILGAVRQAFPEAGAQSADVTRSTDPRFGDYQCNLAMKLAKPLGMAPRAVAHLIVENIPANALIGGMEIAGPGFINITLADQALAHQVEEQMQSPMLGVPRLPGPPKVVVDFSSPNTAKEMHVGHLRSTIIGDSLARLFEFLGARVLRLNHVGDWGTSFGMLIAYMKEHAPGVLSGSHPADLSSLVQWYKQAKAMFDLDLAFRKRAQLEVVALQGGEPAARKAWEIICSISRRDYEKIYQLLDIKLVERGESAYNEALAGIVEEFQKKGLCEVSDGARCIFIEGYQNREGEPLPLMIQKSDGGYNYDTTDLAALKQRLFEEKADRLIYVTDAGQAQHFAMIHDAGQLAGWFQEHPARFDHVPFGLVLGADGKKFKTRSGDTVRLIDLLDEACQAATAIVQERHPDWSAEEAAECGRIIGLDAVKYADLCCHRTKDYLYSPERMLRFEGNTAPFLLYSLVRARSILRRLGRSEQDAEARNGSVRVQLGHPSERALALKMTQFPEVILAMAEDLLPNRLCEYLYELAELFNAFFRDCRVEGSEHQDSRLALVAAAARILHQGLSLLGLRDLERM
jgi:arginyl-tRNA synthetase